MIDTPLPQSEPVSLPERQPPPPERPPGRVVRSALGYGLVTAVMLISPLLVFVPAALFHCGIRSGRRAAWAAFVLGSALAGALFLNPVNKTEAQLESFAGYFTAIVLGIAVPAVVALPLVRRGVAFGQVVVFSVLVGAVGLAATEVLLQTTIGYSLYADRVAQVHETAKQFEPFYRAAGAPENITARFESWTRTLIPAQSLIHVAIVFVLSLLMLGRLKAWREYAAARGAGETLGVYLFRNFSLPEWLLFAFVAGGLTPLAQGMLQTVAANVLTVVSFLYLLQGLAIFRFLITATGMGFFGVTFGWLMLIFLTITGVAPLLLGVAGLFDSFFDFRRFKRKDHSHESHSD